MRATHGAKTIIQIFDLDRKAKVKQIEVQEHVRFWTWITESQLGIVGKLSMYHLDIHNDTEPVKIFDLGPKFAACYGIVDYRTDLGQKWCYLIGKYKNEDGLRLCHCQLFSIERK